MNTVYEFAPEPKRVTAKVEEWTAEEDDFGGTRYILTVPLSDSKALEAWVYQDLEGGNANTWFWMVSSIELPSGDMWEFVMSGASPDLEKSKAEAERWLMSAGMSGVGIASRKQATPSDDLMDVDIEDYMGNPLGLDVEPQHGGAESQLPMAGTDWTPAFKETGWNDNEDGVTTMSNRQPRRRATRKTASGFYDYGGGVVSFGDWSHDEQVGDSYGRIFVKENADGTYDRVEVIYYASINALGGGDYEEEIANDEVFVVEVTVEYKGLESPNASDDGRDWDSYDYRNDLLMRNVSAAEAERLAEQYARNLSARGDYIASRKQTNARANRLTPAESARLRKFRATVRKNVQSGKVKVAVDGLTDPALGWASWSDPRLEGAIGAALKDIANMQMPNEIVARLGQAFAQAGGYQDSIDRERAFALASEVSGASIDMIYRAWLNGPDSWGAEASRHRGSRRTAMALEWTRRTGDGVKYYFTTHSENGVHAAIEIEPYQGSYGWDVHLYPTANYYGNQWALYSSGNAASLPAAKEDAAMSMMRAISEGAGVYQQKKQEEQDKRSAEMASYRSGSKRRRPFAGSRDGRPRRGMTKRAVTSQQISDLDERLGNLIDRFEAAGVANSAYTLMLEGRIMEKVERATRSLDLSKGRGTPFPMALATALLSMHNYALRNHATNDVELSDVYNIISKATDTIEREFDQIVQSAKSERADAWSTMGSRKRGSRDSYDAGFAKGVEDAENRMPQLEFTIDADPDWVSGYYDAYEAYGFDKLPEGFDSWDWVDQQEYLNDLRLRGYGSRKRAKRKTAMPNPVDLGVKVGDIFYSSWGYDQTNVNFYEVVGLTGASVKVREVHSQTVGEAGGPSESVVPIPGAYRGDVMTKRINAPSGPFGGQPDIKINSVQWAFLWDGKPKHRTGFGWGH